MVSLCIILILDWQVQSDHFENFFSPELEKRGYSAIYKKKTKEVCFLKIFLDANSNAILDT